jgi:ABC-type branched-subunit amino acid transport system ATPase component/ABC-type branched-subunit amino acid transport system permease subunit
MGGASAFRRNLTILAIALVTWLGFGMIISNPYYRLLMTLVPIWGVLAISWNVFSGYSGLVSFGHAAFFGLGAFTVGIGLKFLDLTPWLGIPLATVLGGIAGMIIGYPTFRLRGTYFALAMLAYPLALIAIFEWLGLQELAVPMKREAPVYFAQFDDFRVYLVMSLGLLAITALISLRIERSRFGLSLLAIKQNELAAEAAGIDTFRWKLRAMILSAAMASTAGALYTIVVLVITPASVFGVVVSAQAMILTLFGGAGTVWGPLIGAAILVPLSETLQAELGHLLPGIQGLVYGVAIISVILIAPEGIYWRVRDALGRKQGDTGPASSSTEAVHEPTDLPERAVPTATDKPILSVRDVSKAYGGLKAVQNVSFDVPKGGIVGIIGPNGAGKTTLFNLLNGIVKPNTGTVTFEGEDVTGLKPNQIAKRGIGRTFQVVRAFPRLSVLENVVAGAFVAYARDEDAWAAAHASLDHVGLASRAHVPAGRLTSRELRLMELARALAGKPRLILLDEPLAGLGAGETQEMINIVRRLPTLGVTVVIIEHTMHAMVNTVDTFIVLDHGVLLTSGLPQVVTRDKRVIEAYLGRKWAVANAQD